MRGQLQARGPPEGANNKRKMDPKSFVSSPTPTISPDNIRYPEENLPAGANIMCYADKECRTSFGRLTKSFFQARAQAYDELIM